MTTTRREFARLMATVAAVPSVSLLTAETAPRKSTATELRSDLEYRSKYIHVQMAEDQPGFTSFVIDSLGKNTLDGNLLLPLGPSELRYRASRKDQTIEYSLKETEGRPAWSFTFSESGFVVRSAYSPNNSPRPLILNFSIDSHATLLGILSDYGTIRLPAILHFPSHGSFRLTTEAKGITLGYDALRGSENFVQISFPAATVRLPELEYRLEIADIYPDSQKSRIEHDPLYDAYRRDFLSILQINPRRRVLANNVASDPCAFTVFEYSMMAVQMPPLAEGLTALNILRQTLDRYVGEMKGYGMKGYDEDPVRKYDFLDTYPSLVMATSDYVQASQDTAWLKRNYSVIKSWADKMIEFDRDDDGLMEYPLSGNSGSWSEKMTVRPANWWDTIGFGHKDAYANALAYKAFNGMKELAHMAGHISDAETYKGRSEKLKTAYYSTFYNPATGVLAGWRSADGKLHDYYFLFISGMAVVYGLVTQGQGNQIWDKLIAKMKEVGYNRFDLGLPGNLIPVRREDYADHNKRYGGSVKADGSDGFQIYENGGATACYAYFTIQALRDLGRVKEADAILFPMLKSLADGGFQGRGPNGNTYDWMSWDGTPHGYEGLLVDGYLTLLAAMPVDSKS